MKIDIYKDKEWIDIGDGPIRIKVLKDAMTDMGIMFYLCKKMFEIKCELQWDKFKRKGKKSNAKI